jgi:hypothetical protein
MQDMMGGSLEQKKDKNSAIELEKPEFYGQEVILCASVYVCMYVKGLCVCLYTHILNSAIELEKPEFYRQKVTFQYMHVYVDLCLCVCMFVCM